MDKTESPRQRAERLGETYYYNDMPCKYGHLSKRNTTSGGCIACDYERTKKVRARIKATKDAIRGYG